MISELFESAKKTCKTGLWKGFQLSLIVGYLEFIWLTEGPGLAVAQAIGGFLVFLGLVAVDF